MVGALSELLDSARKASSALDANLEIGLMRDETEQRGVPGLSYEVVVPLVEPWRHLTEVALPRLVYFLDCRGQLREKTPGVFVSAFVGEKIYFFDAGDFISIVARKASLSLDDCRTKWGERTGGPAKPATPKLLGG